VTSRARIPAGAAPGILAACLLVLPGCASRTPAPLAAPPVVDARDGRVRALQRDLATILDVPTLRRGLAAVVVRSTASDATLFRYHDDTLVLPASNMKLVTLAAAAERLGWDYTFTTTIRASVPMTGGVVDGDLVVTGTGDPSIGGREQPASSVMDAWADRLWQIGLRHVTGRLVGDDRSFPGEPLGPGWAWDDLAWGYAAPVGALQANVDAAEIVVTPGVREGDAATVTITPAESGLGLVSAVATGPAHASTTLSLSRQPGTDLLRVGGLVAAGSAPITRTAAIDRPTSYFLALLQAALLRRGITVDGVPARLLDLPGPEWPPLAGVLLEHRSPPLRELAQTLMKASQNQYAETLLRVLAQTNRDGPATLEGGRDVVRGVLVEWGVAPDTLVQADGSGLSRYNYVTAGTLASILVRMHADVRHREPWLASLAVGGVDGTLERRFKGTAADGRLRAKTGTLAYVRALSGYVPSADGELLAFVVVLNNVSAPGSQLNAITDAIVLRLAQFRR
jgi:D-alanyl-D-alanine carboxypeptidase/D-alanyl-D-alanine-endopeptidase (penicillin-binding protein 4)